MKHKDDPGKRLIPSFTHPRLQQRWYRCHYCRKRGELEDLLESECKSAPNKKERKEEEYTERELDEIFFTTRVRVIVKPV